MCLALPGQVVENEGFFAIVRIGKIRRKVLNATEARIGEWVIVENGMASETMGFEEGQLMAEAWNAKRKKKKNAQ